MISSDALRHLSEFARLQGDLVRHFLDVYAPTDRERFRDVQDGTFSIDGKSWAHRRHGAGVLFVGPGDILVNAHVAMADHPEAIDAGRLYEYLESIGLGSVSFEGREYLNLVPDIAVMLGDMVRFGILREVVTQGGAEEGF